MSVTYNPAPTLAFEKEINVPISRFAVVENFQATALIALIQPLFSSQLVYAEDPGPPGWEYQYPDSNDTRRVYAFYSEDHKVQAQWVGPLIEIMFKQGDGMGEWAMVSRKEVGGKNPGREFPPTLTWIPGNPSNKPTSVVTSVTVSSEQAKLLVG